MRRLFCLSMHTFYLPSTFMKSNFNNIQTTNFVSVRFPDLFTKPINNIICIHNGTNPPCSNIFPSPLNVSRQSRKKSDGL